MAAPVITSPKGLSDAEKSRISQLWIRTKDCGVPLSSVAIPGYHRLNHHG